MQVNRAMIPLSVETRAVIADVGRRMRESCASQYGANI